MAARKKKQAGNARERQRRTTEDRLVRAVGRVLGKHGFSGLGVNAVAEEAGVPKPLIYRYFGGLDGLVRAYAETADFWPSVEEILGDDDDALRRLSPADLAARAISRYAHALQSRPRTLQLLAWECVERTPVAAALESAREATFRALLSRLRALGFRAAEDAGPAVAVLSAAAHYLAMRRRFIPRYAGLDLSGDEHVRVLARTLASLVLHRDDASTVATA